MALEVKDIQVEVEGTEIVHGISLLFESGKVHALMGPNGSGKSTLAHALMGHPRYHISRGSIILDGKDITAAKPNERAKAGIFLSFQYPSEVSGVTYSLFLRTALNSLRESRGQKPLSVLEFHALLKEKMALLKMDSSFSRRGLNEGFSGGEKKRAEILQLLVLEPKYALLDETDSGLDVDAIRIVAEGIRLLKEKTQMGVIIITHYNQFLESLQPDTVSVMMKGRIVAQGGRELAGQVESEGFEGREEKNVVG